MTKWLPLTARPAGYQIWMEKEAEAVEGNIAISTNNLGKPELSFLDLALCVFWCGKQ